MSTSYTPEIAARLEAECTEIMAHYPTGHERSALIPMLHLHFLGPPTIQLDGQPVLLADQDRRRWDRLLIRRGLDALARADGGRVFPIQDGIPILLPEETAS